MLVRLCGTNFRGQLYRDRRLQARCSVIGSSHASQRRSWRIIIGAEHYLTDSIFESVIFFGDRWTFTVVCMLGYFIQFTRCYLSGIPLTIPICRRTKYHKMVILFYILEYNVDSVMRLSYFRKTKYEEDWN